MTEKQVRQMMVATLKVEASAAGRPTPTERNMTRFDNTVAYSEGWGLFAIDGGDEYRIQKLDDPKSVDESYPDDSPFKDDREAFHFVVDKACEGSKYHRMALWLEHTALKGEHR